MTTEQLQAARAEKWRQKANPLLTIEEAEAWVESTGVSLFLPRKTQLQAPAASFVEAILGETNATPAPAAIQNAFEMAVRLFATEKATPLNLFGAVSEQPDFLVSPEALPYVFALRGDRDWKRGPRDKSSPLVVDSWQLLKREGALTTSELQELLGREVTETAVLRVLSELWAGFRVLPVYAPGEATTWELFESRHQRAMQIGGGMAQATALSALVSLYLDSAIAATSDEIETFLSPLAPRSRVREVVRGLAATRQLLTISLGAQSLLHIAGGLPEFPTIETPTEMQAEDKLPEATPPFRERKPFGQRFERNVPSRRERPSFGDRSATGDARRPSQGWKRRDSESASKEWQPRGEQPPFERKPFAQRPKGDAPPRRDRPSFGDRPAAGDARRPSQGWKRRDTESAGKEWRPRGERPFRERKPFAQRPKGDAPPRRDRPSFGDRPATGDARRPSQGWKRRDTESAGKERRPRGEQRPFERKPFAQRPKGDAPPRRDRAEGGFKRPYRDREDKSSREENFRPRDREQQRPPRGDDRRKERSGFPPRRIEGGEGFRKPYRDRAGDQRSFGKFSRREGGSQKPPRQQWQPRREDQTEESRGEFRPRRQGERQSSGGFRPRRNEGDFAARPKPAGKKRFEPKGSFDNREGRKGFDRKKPPQRERRAGGEERPEKSFARPDRRPGKSFGPPKSGRKKPAFGGKRPGRPGGKPAFGKRPAKRKGKKSSE